jgi:hypothetical protein
LNCGQARGCSFFFGLTWNPKNAKQVMTLGAGSIYQMRYVAYVVLIAVFLGSSCSAGQKNDDNRMLANGPFYNAKPNSGGPANATNANSADTGANSSVPDKTITGGAVARAACMNTAVGGKRAVQKSQTFGIDFEPFKASCFVTSYNPEYGDSHMDTAYDIYKAGKKVFSFPDQFNDSTFGCWVDAVAFQDLDRDGRTDVVIVGKCSAKAGDYNENMVYINTGKTFTTNADGNNQLSDLNTTKDVIDFVEDNKQIFFK